MTGASANMWDTGENPLASSSPRIWDALIESVGPASLLVVIESRMSASLRRAHQPEDILQDSLLHAWRDRAACQWRGLRSFRSWLLTIIDNRIREAADRHSAQKRGGGRETFSLQPPDADSADPSAWGPTGSTTPSRIAVFREQAAAIQAALANLPDDLREVVRLRLFDQLTIDEVAARLNLGEAAVRHRFRKGAELYERLIRDALVSNTTNRVTAAPARPEKSSPVS